MANKFELCLFNMFLFMNLYDIIKGPVAAIKTAQMLVWAASCEIMLDTDACNAIAVYNVSAEQLTWLAFLATRRETIISPATNCLGYHLGVRDDRGVYYFRDISNHELTTTGILIACFIYLYLTFI